MNKSIQFKQYKKESDAKRAYTMFMRNGKKISNVFKHRLNDKRFKNQLRFALLIF